MDVTLPLRLLVSLLLGAFIGLEREYHKDELTGKKHPYSSLGIRTFSLLSLLGGLAGALFTGYPSLSLVLSGAAMLLIVANYIMGTLHTKDSGITTELASVLSFITGFVVVTDTLRFQTTSAMVVVATLILSRKETIKNAVSRLHAFETNSFINYAIIALVVLPFLPNQPIRLSDIPFVTMLAQAYSVSLGAIGLVELINPYKLWFVVALITGVDMLGYFLNKYVGQGKGRVISAVTGGFISSTATTIALAQESKRISHPGRLVAAAVFSNTTSFIQLLLLLAPTSTALLTAAMTPVLVMTVSGLVAGVLFLRTAQDAENSATKKKTETSVFSLVSALKFAAIYVLVRFGSGVGIAVFGNSSIYATSALGALAGLDAVTLNLADMVTRNVIPVSYGTTALLVANAVNLLAKTGYSYTQGSRKFTVQFGLSMLLLIVVSFLATTL